MSQSNEKVMAAVEAAVAKNPGASVDDLFEMAKGVDASVGNLTKRQFHGRYTLQIKKRAALARKRAAPAKAKKAGGEARKAAGAAKKKTGTKARKTAGAAKRPAKAKAGAKAPKAAGASKRPAKTTTKTKTAAPVAARKPRGGPRKKGRKAAGGRRAAAPPSGGGSPRDAVRQAFLHFASRLAAAEARKDLVNVVAGVDEYVDDVLSATSAR